MSESVVAYTDTRNVLHPLIIMLNDFLKSGSPHPIPEIEYLNQMSRKGSVPGEKFYSRAIIEHIVNRHKAFVANVWNDQFILQTFICFYYVEGQMRMHKFSNTMPLYADIITMQYLYILRRKYGDFPPRVKYLATLMTNKYTIQDDVYCEICEIICESCNIDCANSRCFCKYPTRITLGRVFRSFQSITLWMYNYISELATHIRSVFPSNTLSPMIGSPYFPLILSIRIRPRSSHMYLLALNIAVCVTHDSKPILSIVHRMIQCYSSDDVYTEDMRLDICNKLGIAIIKNGMYVFGRTFEMHSHYYAIAKYKIRNIRQRDETLREALELLRRFIV